jgi:hypothetical protein
MTPLKGEHNISKKINMRLWDPFHYASGNQLSLYENRYIYRFEQCVEIGVVFITVLSLCVAPLLSVDQQHIGILQCLTTL